MLKKFNKLFDKVEEALQGKRFAEALELLGKVRAVDSTTPFFVTEYAMIECQSYTQTNDVAKALQACTLTLELDPKRVEALLHRATAHELEEDFEAAIEDLRQAGELEENSQRVKERLQRAERQLKQSKKRDYYKILGVPRNANKRQITKV